MKWRRIYLKVIFRSFHCSHFVEAYTSVQNILEDAAIHFLMDYDEDADEMNFVWMKNGVRYDISVGSSLTTYFVVDGRSHVIDKCNLVRIRELLTQC